MCLGRLRKSTNVLIQECQFLIQEIKEEFPGYELGFAMFGESDEEVSVHKWLKFFHSNRLHSIANPEY